METESLVFAAFRQVHSTKPWKACNFGMVSKLAFATPETDDFTDGEHASAFPGTTTTAKQTPSPTTADGERTEDPLSLPRRHRQR